VLISAKSQLVAGNAVLCMIDKHLDNNAIVLSQNLFKLAQLSKTPLIFLIRKFQMTEKYWLIFTLLKNF
jgi:hypothetical protein